MLSHCNSSTRLTDWNLASRMVLKNNTIRNNDQKEDCKRFYGEDKPDLKASQGYLGIKAAYGPMHPYIQLRHIGHKKVMENKFVASCFIMTSPANPHYEISKEMPTFSE